ncbi:MAG: diacylglycerol kinase [Marivirga sp.]|nr:diacylglycerol kinase [Marivirga sp.]
MDRNIGKALFIVNKHAGIGYQSKLEGRIIDTCEKNNVTCTIEFTQGRGHAIELAREAKGKGYSQVIAVGGDGTSNEVAQGLIHEGIPMGIIPRGSGNGLARHLGIPLRTHEAIAQVFQSKVLSMDVFKVNGKLSLNVSGIGFDGHVTNQFGIKSTRGLFGYVMLTVKEFLKFQEFNTEIITHDNTYVRDAFIIAIANSSQYGNNAKIAPSASVCDGLLDVNIMKKIPFYRLDFLYAFFAGKLDKSSFCEILETPSVQFKTRRPVAYHVDGEPCGLHDRFQIELIRGALQILIPDNQGGKIV